VTKVILDAQLKGKLLNLSQPLELCDESGRVLGRVFPAPDLSSYEPLEPQVSEEELDCREQANEKCYTTAEVLAYLDLEKR
jgi:hypothetical protein